MDPKDHLVSLKVMRLLKPSIYSALPIYTEQSHFTDNFSQLLLDQAFNLNSFNELNIPCNSSMSDFLVIPQIFGNLYIGETFTSYICLHNQSQIKVSQLNIKIELQTTTQKVALKFKSELDTVEEFEIDQNFDGIVEHDVKELGNHILICIVSYLNDKKEKMSFKKFYKFVVSKPFEIQPKYPFADSQGLSKNDQIVFEAQIQNITNSVLYMERVLLQPLKESVHITEINQFNSDNFRKKNDFNTFSILKPSEVKQYLFKVVYKDDFEKEKKPLQVGKLDINWRYSLGENGHLQTHPLEQPMELSNLYHREIELKFEINKKELIVDEAISFKCFIKNKSERELDLIIKLNNSDKYSGFLWNCNLNYEIGNLAPKSTHVLDLNLVPIQVGLIAISGISITDLFLKRLHEFNNVYNLYVLPKKKSSLILSHLNQN